MQILSPFRAIRPSGWSSPFDEFFNDFDRSLDQPVISNRDFSPAMDVEEKDGVYLVTVDLPGIKKDDININLSDRTLIVSGERSKETKGQGHYYERSYGRFARSLTLPENVDGDKMEAHYEDGVLNMVLPKVETAKSKTVKIQSGKPSGMLEKFFTKKNEETKVIPEKH